jgi:hypothetical protein
MITPTTIGPLPTPTVDGEPPSHELNDELGDLLESIETQDLPQAVLSLLQQVVLPDLLKLTMPHRFATPADWVKPTAIRPADGERGRDLSSPIAQQKPRLSAQDVPGGAVRVSSLSTPAASLHTPSAASRLMAVAPADISTRSVVEAQLTRAGVPLVVNTEARDYLPPEVGDKPVQPAANLPSHSPAAVAASMEASGPMYKTMPQSPGEMLVIAEQPYLRLPFAKDGVVGHINVSKSSDTSIQLQLAGSSSDVTRHLALHLDSAEPNWRLTDDQPSGQQHERNARQHSEDDAEDPDAHSGTPKWQS